MTEWAEDFYEIPDVLEENEDLRDTILNLVEDEPIPGKVTEGRNRNESLRGVLTEYFTGNIELDVAISRVSSDLRRHESPHAGNNRVFPQGWEERLVRTQVSRFYNQAVLLTL